MALVVPNISAVMFLHLILNKSGTYAQADPILKLYSNDYTPITTSVVGNFTEVTGGGYASKTLTGNSWTVSAGGVASYAQQTWTFTGSVGNVYGYYLTNASGDLFWAERFTDGPYNIAASGEFIKVTPQITAASS